VAFTELRWSLREPVIAQGDRVTEPWRCEALNSGPLWIGLPATGRRLDTIGTDIFEFRDGKVCREHSFYDVTENLRQLGLWPGIGSPVERGLMGVAGLGVRARKAIAR
jgi:predicted ester cyclase